MKALKCESSLRLYRVCVASMFPITPSKFCKIRRTVSSLRLHNSRNSKKFFSPPPKHRHGINHFFLFQLNEHNMLNAHIYHHLPPTCFSVRYTVFGETTALFVQKLCCLQCCYTGCAVKRTTYPVLLSLQTCCSVYNNMYFILLYLPTIPRQRNNVTRGSGPSPDLCTSTDPNTAGYSEHIHC